MSRPCRLSSIGVVLAFVLALALAPVVAVHAQEPPPATGDDRTAAHAYFTDLRLVDQHGETHEFYSDLLADKVVVINAFFARCEGVCPAMNAKLVQVQKWLGERLGDEVVMLSITVDAAHDTPEVLSEYARQWDARPGWYFLTGDPETVDRALYKLGQYVEQKEGHTSIVIMGNEPTGLWKKAQGLASPQDLVAILDSVISDTGAR